MFFRKKVYASKVRLEASTLCNLNCRDCYMRLNHFGNVGAGYLKLENFVSFLDKNPFVREIELSNSGEVFLNPDLLDILKIAYERGVNIYLANGVNLNKVSDEMLEGLVKYGVKVVLVSIDGASQETYVKYRRGGNFDTVINNIKKINEYKKKYNSILPIMQWQYIVMDTNDSEEEILRAKEIAKSLDCTVWFKKTWNDKYKPKNPEILSKLTGLNFSDDEVVYTDNKRLVPCADLWKCPQINWDGRFLACCANFKDPFDVNVFEVGLEKLLNSKLIKDTKKMLMGGKVCKDSPCRNCYFYKKMAESKNFVKEDEIINQWKK